MSSSLSSTYQQYIDQVGSYAKTSTPAYSLASLFALCAPFAFPGGRDQSRIQSPLPNSPLGKALRSSLNPAKALRSSLPPFWQLAGFATFFGAGGYMIDKGDSLNGAGTVTGETISSSVVDYGRQLINIIFSLVFDLFVLQRYQLATTSICLATCADYINSNTRCFHSRLSLLQSDFLEGSSAWTCRYFFFFFF